MCGGIGLLRLCEYPFRPDATLRGLSVSCAHGSITGVTEASLSSSSSSVVDALYPNGGTENSALVVIPIGFRRVGGLSKYECGVIISPGLPSIVCG
jgi:hypothetical protein